MTTQTEIVRLEDLVALEHNYRKFKEYIPVSFVLSALNDLATISGNKGYGIERMFYCLLLQFMEDLSDRELEKFLQENNAGKWFCGFGLTETTPDYTSFTKVRAKIGTHRLSVLFSSIKNKLKENGLISEVFTFVDASHLVSKANLWEERDKVIAKKYEELNNKVLSESKVASDKQARIGCKGGNKYWFGYKKHVSVDMQSGLINKVAITPANVIDAEGLKHVCPSSGAVYADKGYCIKPAQDICRKKSLHLAAIKLNNMKTKNKDLDKYYSAIRSPYERVFSQQNRRVRYKGISKNQFAVFMQALSFNLKRLIRINAPPFYA